MPATITQPDPRLELARLFVEQNTEFHRTLQTILGGASGAMTVVSPDLQASHVSRLESPSQAEDGSSPLLRELLDPYLMYLRDAYPADGTFRAYRSRVRRFVEYFGQRKVGDLRSDQVRDYLLGVAATDSDGKQYTGNTQRITMSAISNFQNWALSNGHVNHRFVENIPRPEGERRERAFTEYEIEQVLKFPSREFALAFQALCESGARPNEIVSARIEDVDWSKPSIQLITRKPGPPQKSDEQRRTLQMSESLRRIVADAVGGRKRGHIFVDENRKPLTPHRLSRWFRNVRRKANLSTDLVLTSTLHVHAQRLLREQGSYAVAQARGFTSIQSVRRYQVTSQVDVEDKVFVC